MSEREEVLNEFGTAECVKRDDCTHFDCVAERKMADEIVRLRTALTTAERERDEARRERDEVIAACRGTQIDAAGLRELKKLRQRAERAERDGVLLDFLADDPPFDEFHGIDIYETWGEVAAKYGREEPNAHDKREAFRLLLSRARNAAEGVR